MAVYLLHFDEPLGHTRHYSGFAKEADCKKRLQRHADGNGARLLQVAIERGITWQVAKIWPEADRAFERKLKARGQSTICPLCVERARAMHKARQQRYRLKKRNGKHQNHS